MFTCLFVCLRVYASVCVCICLCVFTYSNLCPSVRTYVRARIINFLFTLLILNNDNNVSETASDNNIGQRCIDNNISINYSDDDI